MNRTRIIEALGRARDRLEAPALRASARFAGKLRTEVVAAYRKGKDPWEVLGGAWQDWAERLTGIMIYADVHGRLAFRQRVSSGRALARATDIFTIASVSDFAKKRLDMTSADIGILRDTYLPRAIAASKRGAVAVEKSLRGAVQRIIEEGQHVRQGVKTLRAAMEDAGIGSVAPYVLQTMARSEIAIAYSGGRQAALADPDVADMVWGYEYVTVGDDRVRPEHAGLDGVKLPKDDPQWHSIMPPNGYNCRCMTIEILSDEAPRSAVRPPAEFDFEYADGRTVTVKPGPDPGWDFNPADL